MQCGTGFPCLAAVFRKSSASQAGRKAVAWAGKAVDTVTEYGSLTEAAGPWTV